MNTRLFPGGLQLGYRKAQKRIFRLSSDFKEAGILRGFPDAGGRGGFETRPYYYAPCFQHQRFKRPLLSAETVTMKRSADSENCA